MVVNYIKFNDTEIEFIDGDRGIHYPKKEEFSSSGYCVFLNTGNVTSNGFNFNDLDFITKEKDELLRKGRVIPHDIVLTTRGTVGNVAYVSENELYKNIRINSGMVIIRSDCSKYEPYFLYSFFRSELFKKQCEYNGSGSAQPQLPISALKNISFPNFNLETQQKIAQVLSTLDRKIALNQQINAELEKMAKTLYDYWFVQFDFPDENGNPYKSSGGEMVYNPELKRNVPKGWGVKKLSEHLDCNRKKLGKNHRLSFINYLDTSNLTNNKIDDVQFLKADKGKIPSRANMIVSHNDILFSTVRPNQNHFGLIKNPIENLIGSTGFAVLSHKENSALNSIFYLCITSKNNLQKLISISESATSSYPSINNNDILNLLICLPKDICILEKLAEIFDSIFEKQSIVEKENKKLTQLRDFLLPMLMNGQVEVV